MGLSLFGMELCLPLGAESPLHRALNKALLARTPGLERDDKRRQYQGLADTLTDALPDVESACWDYVHGNDKAKVDYALWSNGVLEEAGVRTSPSTGEGPYRGEPRYLTFTMAMLIVQGSPTGEMLSEVCDIEEARFWHRATFAHLLAGVRRIDFAHVKSDVLYLLPRDLSHGLTAQDLLHLKFKYLRKLV